MDKNLLLSELSFKATRSSGAGGQHVNKTSSRVELYWSLDQTTAFSYDEVSLLRTKLSHRLTKDGVIQLASQQSRSQHKNKEDVTKRFLALLKTALIPPKIRKKKRPSKIQKLKRLKAKKHHAEKKASRKKPDY